MALGQTLTAAMLLGAVANAILFVFVWPERQRPGARAFATLLVLEVSWCLLTVLSLLVADQTWGKLLSIANWGVSAIVPVGWLAFALAYTGRGHLLTRRTLGVLLVVPVTTVPMLLTNGSHGLGWSGFVVVEQGGLHPVSFTFEPWLLVVSAYAFVLVAGGIVLLLEFVVAGDDLYSTQSLALVVAGVLPAVTSAKQLLGIGPLPLVDLTPLAFAVTGPLLAYTLFRYDLFRHAPAIRQVGRRAVLDDFGDGVVILDEDERVLDLNAAAQRLLDTGDRIVDRPLSDLFGTDEVDLDDPSGTVRIETNRGRREFDLAVSDVSDRADRHIGYTVVLHDVTDEKQRQQRLEVLNRILRHNLRNTMTAVMGYARRLEDHADEEGQRMTERIQSQSTRLVDLSEKAREIDRVTDPSRAQERFEIEDVFDCVTERVTDDHGVTVTTSVPGSLTMTSDRVIVEEMLRYAAEVLLAYDDSDAPRLVFSATPTDASRPWLELTVTSDGDPVPGEEREVIERGEETPLEHSRDLELWLVSWGVETLGGDLSFIEDEDRPGLSLSVPDFEHATDGSGDEEFPF